MNATIARSLDLRGVPDGTHLATAAATASTTWGVRLTRAGRLSNMA
jgi:hypothetical protein